MTSQTPEFLKSELPAIQLFEKLGYQYFDASKHDERASINEVILETRLKSAIKRINPWLNENNINNAFKEITAVASASLMEANEFIHKLLSSQEYTPKQIIDGKETYKGVSYIDFENIENNDFLLVNQMKFKGLENNSIPDLVVFINGMPLSVIECKSPKLQGAEQEAISDLKYYQVNSEKLFRYNQICVAAYKVGGRYGAIGAKEGHYQVYRSEDNAALESLLEKEPTAQDILLFNLFEKDRFLDLIRNFIIYHVSEGSKIKILPRYQQIRATNKTIHKLQTDNEGGVVWHTQGSGKSITMVYLATKLRREESGFKNPTIIILTDRTDLDNQISSTFTRCGFQNPIQATSVRHLKKLLEDDYGKTIMTTIQKFQETDDDGNIVKVSNEQIEVVSEKENLFVMVDEAHRTQYGFLAGFMRKALKNAKFIAFTGTPIDNDEKSTLGKFYGGKYLDIYNIKQSVADGATLPILYEDGIPELYVEKELLEKQFKYYFDQESKEKQAKLKQEATSLKKQMTGKQRINRIAEHIINHYKTKIYPDGFKGMVVCYNRPSAIAYKKAFDKLKEAGKHGFSSRVVMSFSLKKDPPEYFKLATPDTDIKQAIEDFKLPFGDELILNKAGRKQFNNDALMIVSDMLLTGYDVPVAMVMYLDKPLKAHNLLQAIARVNRTRGAKPAGLIVDYCGITDHLVAAMEIFSGELEPDDVMVNISEEITKLRLRHNRLVAFFQHLGIDRGKQRQEYVDKAVHYLEPIDVRDNFKEILKKFNKSLNIVLPDESALEYKDDFSLYSEIRLEASNAYMDKSLRISKDESKKLQSLIDEHLRAKGIISLLDEPVSIIDVKKFEKEINKTKSGKSKELKISNRLRHKIKVEIDNNPDFYGPLSDKLEELIKMRRKNQITQVKLFKEFDKIQEKIVNKSKEAESMGFSSDREFAVYKTLEYTLDDAKGITGQIFQGIEEELSITDWQVKGEVKKSMRKNIKDVLRGKVESNDIQSITVSLVDLIKRN
ncbi:MAG: type I restriction endonuclease subunit R [Desulfobacula sp.]|jgi:type I restriction enzyme, R subunit|uniref:type I restriction endonuclease subunit R n=2 Tax=Desulfobacula sp. TaxID=2593537 RepID=UPI001D5814EA|nr:type I restriction endonuclease subunit R [Desulfobacula sp.]MBT4025484.1 type I restriction endonuclease subunit R [Desulfobacula sp.]MBT6340932.1 type I restriction endonuclease subunit R [Desulfobacula sp.]MBT7050578.1 type I restriction endonuclease subunit R [Desulfobacula sp.]MBT7793327.1 type I restriction endonuclease subunit R [Desulfobacula sp.]